MRSKIVAATAALVVAGAASNGRVHVRNEGNGKSQTTVVTIVCTKISGRGSCPEPDPKKVAKYLNPAYPNAAVVKFGPIQAGKNKNHVLNFWPGLVFAAGNYRFDLVVDPSNTVAESNEGNNTKSVVKSVP